jgi:GDP-fucose protein O-fucosyltransferase
MHTVRTSHFYCNYNCDLPLHLHCSVYHIMIRYANDKDLIGWLAGRKLIQHDERWQDSKLIHWRAKECRLLTHFYTCIRHTDKAVDNYHKRLIRDIMHYRDEMFCKANQIITMLKAESSSGSFSSFHIRRGDFQFA